jgi:hypothetical protein
MVEVFRPFNFTFSAPKLWFIFPPPPLLVVIAKKTPEK